MRYPVANLGQSATPTFCPPVPPSSVNCQRTPEGGILCSDGTYYPPACAAAFTVRTPGVTPYVRSQGQLALTTPAPYNLAQETGEGFPYIPVAIAVAGIVLAIVF